MRYKELIAAFVVGLVFAVGLAVSGMTLPTKVIGFLDIFGEWDPALAFVMGGAVIVYAIGFRFVTRSDTPRFAPKFSIPTRKDITPRLLIGSAIFGMGWGLGGFCPGPALTSLSTGLPDVAVFVVAMLSGMYLFGIAERGLEKRNENKTDVESSGSLVANR